VINQEVVEQQGQGAAFAASAGAWAAADYVSEAFATCRLGEMW
jgi:hypothetical protein